jgi:glycosyltransferase involved in cell wall biosynthesis
LRNGRYNRNVVDWVQRSASNYDLIYCDAADVEAYAILTQGTTRSLLPVVVRYCGMPLQEESAGSISAPSDKTLTACRRAALIVVSNRADQQQLAAHGIPLAAILRGHQSSGAIYDRSPQSRQAARQILSQCNHDLFVRSTDRLLVCPGELTRRWNIEMFIQELAPLLEQNRWLRIWILGDGRERAKIYELLRHHGLHHLVAMPGVFSDLEQIFQAADACVFPSSREGINWLLPTCIVNKIPIIADNSPEVGHLLGDETARMTFSYNVPGSLRSKLSEWMRNPASWQLAISQVAQARRDSGATQLINWGVLFQRVNQLVQVENPDLDRRLTS